MKLIGAVFCVTALCAAGLGAQTKEVETKSKITVKDGKNMTVVGCVSPAAGGTGFMLTDVADKSGALHNYLLVSSDSTLSKHVGHRVQVTGKVTDRGDAKVKLETTTKTKVEHGDDKETKTETQIEGDASGMPYLGVKSVKLLAAACR